MSAQEAAGAMSEPRLAHLAAEISELFQADQKQMAEFNAATSDDSELQAPYAKYKAEVLQTRDCFYDPFIVDLWVASEEHPPAAITTAHAFRERVNRRVREIVDEHGWPRRKDVGDTAGIMFFFLFGHGDNDNEWRHTQLSNIDHVNQEDKLNPRLYGHMVDRLRAVALKPQLYGTIMGPGMEKGTAKLYVKTEFDEETTNEKRKAIGLASIEEDLEKFRSGAQIGPYMTPMMGQPWDLSDGYRTTV
ncbi:hypothetical protein BD324DRAFT_618894 [Kockovaella imperatae]|uniref:Uncharacterized protein n=1 Tax=Kockovaella imperatae TaxID=4999 RepID=A0A1Y1UQ08_9TREE|nr:hypothetical protein BD324DRAFT_618894 [Kockovaella imperatae]ORX39225.1 hypothetical protein BD324DRAFT_618894 [Kockovaella imperatae]